MKTAMTRLWAVTALCASIFATVSESATITVEPALRSELEKLGQVYGQLEWNNFGSARAGMLDSRSLTARKDDGTRYDTEPRAPIKIIRISGQTEVGDTERLREILDNTRLGYRAFIVMDGPGGSFSEALSLGKLIHKSIHFRQIEGLMGVAVLKGQSCLSSCAVAAAWAGKSLFVEDGATLGFHLPFLPGKKGQQNIQAEKMLNLAYDIASSYNELLIEDLAHRDLFREAYKHRSQDSFFYIRSAFDAVRYGFSGAARGTKAQPVSIEGVGFNLLTELCSSRLSLEPSKKTFVDYEYATPYFYGQTGTLGQLIKARGKRWFGSSEDHGFTDLHCRFGADRSGGLHVWMSRDALRCSAQLCDVATPKSPSAVTNLEMIQLLKCQDGRYSGKKRRAVVREVNLRQSASVKGRIVTRLRDKQNVSITACRITADKQSVWYKVDTGRSIGWASARYFK